LAENSKLEKTQIIQPRNTMSWHFDELHDDNDDTGFAPHPPANVPPVIGVRAGDSVTLAGAASLGLQF
jgi:hypothetical protein